ncbi:hypothetical protein HID58_043917, partial [Brassica napus]
GTFTLIPFDKEIVSIFTSLVPQETFAGISGYCDSEASRDHSVLSTEQRKRLTIAVELVANPSIIFMDEPTSGLDSRAAAIVMRTVRNTVDTGRTVVCTIHQPSIDIFEAFDELLLMKRGGHKQFMEFKKLKRNITPATWMLEVSSMATEAKLEIDFSEH